MIEISFFVNLLDDEFLLFKDEVENIIAKQSKQIELRILPTVDLAMMDQFFTQHHIQRHQLDRRNELFNIGYEATLDFETLTMIASRKKAIDYMNQLHAVLKQTGHFTKENRLQILTDLNIDLDLLERRRQGEIIRDKIQHNLHLSRQMEVQSLPTMIIFNFSQENDVAIKIDQLDELKELQKKIFSSNSIKEAIQQSYAFRS